MASGNVIDELIVALKLDPTQFDEATKKAAAAFIKTRDAARSNAKDIEKSAGSLTEAFSALQGRLLGIASLFLGGMGIKDFAQHVTAATSQIGYMSKQLGMSAQNLSEWQNAGARVGATADEITSSIKSLSGGLADIQIKGTSPLLQYLAAMKIPTLDAKTKQVKAPDQILMEMSQWAQGKDPRVVSQFWSQMGMSSGMTNLLLEGPDKLRQYLAEMKKNAPSDGDVQKLQQLQSAFNKMSADAEALSRTIFMQFVPAIGKVMEFFDKLIEKMTPAVANSRENAEKFIERKLPQYANPPDTSIVGRVRKWLYGGSSGSSTSTPLVRPQSSEGGPSGGAPVRNADLLPSSATARTALTKGYMMDQLRREGVPEDNVHVAASMMTGQAIAESNLRPNLSHDGGTGYGIYGARLDRRSKMFAWLKANGYAANSLEGQARYMVHEAMTDPAYRRSREALMTANRENMARGTWTLTDNFESPAVNNSGARYSASLGALGVNPVMSPDVWTKGAQSIVPHPGLSALQGIGNTSHNNTTSSTHVENLVVNTPSNDPQQHAADIKSALAPYFYMSNANQGPN